MPRSPQFLLTMEPLSDQLLTGIAGMTPEDRASLDLRRKLSPVMVDSILKGVSTGDPESVDNLFSIMIRSWPRLAGNVRKIRDAAASCEFEVHPKAAPDGTIPPESETRAALVRRVLHDMSPRPGTLELDWCEARRYLAEGAIRGTAVMEMLWHVTDDGSGQMASIRALRPTHPRYYGWAASFAGVEGVRDDRLLFRPHKHGHLTDFPENQFLIQLSPSWNEHPAVSALLGTLSMWWIAATYGPQWLMNYSQFFGIPFRWANYPSGDAAARDVVSAMLRNVGAAGWAALPEGSTLNLLETSKGAGDLPQGKIIDLADKVCDILLLGQTLTTDTSGHGSQALGSVHEGVSLSIMRAICGHVGKTATKQVVPPILRTNFGNDDWAPEICHDLEEPEDEKAKAERDEIILRSGILVPKAWYYDRHGIPMPTDGEETVGGPAPAPAPGNGAPVTDSLNPARVGAAMSGSGAGSGASAVRADAEIGDAFLSDLTAVFETTLKEAVAIGWEAKSKELDTA